MGKDQENEVEESPKASTEFRTKDWLPWSIIAMFGFTLRTSFIGVVSNKVGPFTCVYLTFGGIFLSGSYFIIEGIRNKMKPNGSFHVDLNLVKDGKLKIINLLGVSLFVFLYFIAQNLTYLTIWFAMLAKMNVGIITVLWSAAPLMIAIAEYFIYGIQLKRNYLIGMAVMIASAVILSLNTIILNAKEEETDPTKINEKPVVSSWVPVVFALIAPLAFTSRALLIRRMTVPKYGISYDVTTLSMLVFFLSNLLILFISIPYWKHFTFDPYLFMMGTIGIIIDCLALYFIYIALGRGPGGPCAALCSASSIGIVIIEAIKFLQFPSYIEIIGGIIGVIGALEFVIPNHIERLFCPCKRATKKENSTKQVTAMPEVYDPEPKYQMKMEGERRRLLTIKYAN